MRLANIHRPAAAWRAVPESSECNDPSDGAVEATFHRLSARDSARIIANDQPETGMADHPDTLSQRLDSMTTRWSLVRRAHQASILSAGQARNELVLRYSSAIRSYFRAVVRDDARADELAQDAVVRLLSGDFAGADPNRGRFRDLLKTSVRNMARNHWEKENRRRPAAVDVGELAGTADDPNWLSSWRQNALDLTWAALESFERSQPGSSAVALLRLRAADPSASSEELAARLAEKTGLSVTPEALRQQLRRARVKFAELLIEELADGLENASPDEIEEELAALGLVDYVRDLLPADWKERHTAKGGQ
jgi:DNA-directed RNA polymerase specialized sigma24 family protein